MTVRELILALQQLPQEAPVAVWHPVRDEPTLKVTLFLEKTGNVLITNGTGGFRP